MPNSWKKHIQIVYALLIMTVGIACVWKQLQPPSIAPEDSPFELQRALTHLEHIAREPHPTGSAAHAAVRSYLVDQFSQLGLDVTVQEGIVEVPGDYRSDPLHNVIAELPAPKSSGHAIMLAAHYDSVATGPGAADDGAAVAALLEVARILSLDPDRINDILFVITDGEETGLLGATLFVRNFAKLDSIKAVLNFEARGTSGPSIMFETGTQSGWLVQLYAQHAPHPVATSISEEVYRHMPNATDFLVFSNHGLQGLNFAFIGSPQNYHTSHDDIEHLDPRSLLHHGIQALALARPLSRVNLNPPESNRPRVYFSCYPFGVIHHPENWAFPLTLAAVLLLLLGFGWQCTSRHIRIRDLMAGALIGIALLCIVPLAACGCERLILIWQNNVAPEILLVGMVITTACLIAVLIALTSHIVRRDALQLAALFLISMLAILAAVRMVGASYLFIWPLAATGISLLLDAARVRSHKSRLWISIAIPLLASPAILLWLPLAFLVPLGLGPGIGTAVSAAILLMIPPHLAYREIETPNSTSKVGRSSVSSMMMKRTSDNTLESD